MLDIAGPIPRTNKLKTKKLTRGKPLAGTWQVAFLGEIEPRAARPGRQPRRVMRVGSRLSSAVKSHPPSVPPAPSGSFRNECAGSTFICHALETELAGWGGETRTTESIRTEIRLSCLEIFPDLAQGIVQRRFQCELRVRKSAAAAGSWQIMSTGGRMHHV